MLCLIINNGSKIVKSSLKCDTLSNRCYFLGSSNNSWFFGFLSTDFWARPISWRFVYLVLGSLKDLCRIQIRQRVPDNRLGELKQELPTQLYQFLLYEWLLYLVISFNFISAQMHCTSLDHLILKNRQKFSFLRRVPHGSGPSSLRKLLLSPPPFAAIDFYRHCTRVKFRL